MSETPPVVSVVVPVYNAGPYARESLDSILAQTYPRIEVIVMDDASTDDTQQIVQSYGSAVQYYRHASNQGQFNNVNAGLAKARGEYIAVYHADDIYAPTIVEREVACFEAWPQAGAVFCQDIFIDRLGREYGRLTLPPEVRGSRPLPFPVVFNALLTYQNNFLVCPSAMVRAAAYREIGLYRPIWRESADLEMWLRISQRFPIVVLEEYLLKYRHFPLQAHRRYNRFRTEPALHFGIIARCLGEGGDRQATPAALQAHRGHQAEDRLMNVVNLYIIGDLARARRVLADVRLAAILGTPRINRPRMVALFGLLQIACRVRRIGLVGALFQWRWQSGRQIGNKHALTGLGAALEGWWRNESGIS